MTRKAILEPVAPYACSAWMPHALPTTPQKIERAQNVAVTLQRGCCKPSSIEMLCQLPDTRSLREEATKAASIRLERNTPNPQPLSSLSMTGIKKKCGNNRSTTKETEETRLAQILILPLARLPFPLLTTQKISRPLPNAFKFFYTDCTTTDKDTTRLKCGGTYIQATKM